MSKVKFLKSQVHIRPATEADISFLFNSWLKSYKASPAVKSVPGAVYFDAQHKVLEQIFKRSQVLVACAPTDHNQIFGYCCTEIVDGVNILHYAYTKEAFRRMGLQALLLEEAKLTDSYFYSHYTKLFAEQIRRNNFKAVYNPYLQHTYPQEKPSNEQV